MSVAVSQRMSGSPNFDTDPPPPPSKMSEANLLHYTLLAGGVIRDKMASTCSLAYQFAYVYTQRHFILILLGKYVGRKYLTDNYINVQWYLCLL